MQKCKYDGKAIYAFDVKGENEIVKYDLEREWRKASEKGMLVCDECGEPVRFSFGKVYRPYFAHKSELQGGNPCTYSNETEEHIEGKKILLKYMKSLYPGAFAEVRYRLPERKRADLYFKFEDGQELVIEFQRQGLSVNHWDEKREFYKRIGLNNIWFLSGKKEEMENVIREYQLEFWNRMILNDLDNIILFLNVEKEEITILKKIIVKDKDTDEVIFDRLYNKTYPLKDIFIQANGRVECDFHDEYQKESNSFVQRYIEQKEKEREEKERLQKAHEEQERKRREEREEREKKNKEERERLELLIKQKNEAREINERTDAYSEIGYIRKGSSQSSYNSNQKKSYSNYEKDESYYIQQVNKAILGHRYGVENLVNTLARGGYYQFNIINKAFEERINNGDIRAKKVRDEVMKKAGLD